VTPLPQLHLGKPTSASTNDAAANGVLRGGKFLYGGKLRVEPQVRNDFFSASRAKAGFEGFKPVQFGWVAAGPSIISLGKPRRKRPGVNTSNQGKWGTIVKRVEKKWKGRHNGCNDSLQSVSPGQLESFWVESKKSFRPEERIQNG